MRRKSYTPIVVVAAGAFAALVLLAVGGLAIGGGSVTFHEGLAVQYTDAAPVVTDKRESGGFGFFGLQLGSKSYTVGVSRIIPARCGSLVDFQGDWPPADPECRDQIPITGQITGFGTLPDGRVPATIEARVSRDCYESIEVGDDWRASEQCAEHRPR